MTDLLFRHLVESTLLCMLLGSVTYGLRKQAAAVRHSVWLIGILKFAIPTIALTATGARMAFLLPATDWTSALAARWATLLAALFVRWPGQMKTGMGWVLSVVFLTIWLSGSAVLFATWLLRLRRRPADLSLAPHSAREALDRAEGRLNFRSAVTLRCCAKGNDPTLAGVFRPLITIPRGLAEQLTPAELEAVLLHELAHARRRDNLTALLVRGLICAFWFHPLLWFVEQKLLAERERACDEIVMNCGTTPEVYLAGLSKVCRFQLFGNVAGVSAVTGSDLSRRFDQILFYRVRKRVPYAFRLVIAGFTLSVTLLPIAGGYCEQCVSQGQGMTSKSRKDKTEAARPRAAQQFSLE